MNAEQIMKAALDGKLFSVGDTGRTVCKEVPLDHIPDHRPLYGPLDSENDGLPRPFTPEQDEMIMEARSAGVCWREVGKMIGRCLHATRDRYMELCRERGIKPVTVHDVRSKISPEMRAEIYSLRRQNLQFKEIAALLGITTAQAFDAYKRTRRMVLRREAAQC